MSVNVSEILKRVEELKKEKEANDLTIKKADRHMLNSLREACVELNGGRK